MLHNPQIRIEKHKIQESEVVHSTLANSMISL